RGLDRRADQHRLRQRVQSPVGAFPAPYRRLYPLPLGPARGRQGRPACRVRAAILARPRLGHRSGVAEMTHPEQTMNLANIQTRRQPGRTITGMAAMLLPFTASGQIAEDAYAALLQEAVAAGLTPAVNMDTGYVNLL